LAAASITHVAVDDPDAQALQLRAVPLAPRPDEVVQPRDLVSPALGRERARDGASRKAADSGYQYSHARFRS